MIEDDEVRDVWLWINDHFRRYHSCPSRAAVKRQFRQVNIDESIPDSMDYLLSCFFNDIRVRRVRESMRDVVELMKDPRNHELIDTIYLEHARKTLQTTPGATLHRFSDVERRIDAYRAKASKGSIMGIRMGIPAIDKETFGIQPHELVTIAGYLSDGKSTLLQYILFNAYMQGKTAMLISMEMDWETLMRRWDVMKTNVLYRNMKSHVLTQEEFEKWQATVPEHSKMKSDIIVPDIGTHDWTVDRVHAEILRHQPDIVGVDYLTQMALPGNNKQPEHERTSMLSREMKQMAMALRVPIIQIAQGNRDWVKEKTKGGGAETFNIGKSISIAQDSDIMLAIYRSEDLDKNNQFGLRMIKNRDGKRSDVVMEWDLERMQIAEAFEGLREPVQHVPFSGANS